MPELLAPAGTLRHLQSAFAYGADAVYAGFPRYGLRVRENHFKTVEDVVTAIDAAHKQQKKIYITTNIYAHNSKVNTFVDDIRPLVAAQPDALIMADPGLIMLAREAFPEIPIHLSVQANTLNYAAVRFWQQLGVERIILSRELALDEVREIRQMCPDMELEVFVHGALCIAYSGRCLLSGFINHRDANQGTCTNACRWEYREAETTPQAIDIEEIGRPGETMTMEEDEHGSYIMNSKDLRAIQYVQDLFDMGIDSLKIEGRTKSIYYVSRVVQSYRQALDDAAVGKAFDATLLDSLDNLANRGYTAGFFERHESVNQQNYTRGNSVSSQQLYVADIIASDGEILTIHSRNKIRVGDTLEIILPQGNQLITLECLQDKHGHSIEEVPGGGFEARIVHAGITDVSFGLVAKIID
jgi:U32 family peptidase